MLEHSAARKVILGDPNLHPFAYRLDFDLLRPVEAMCDEPDLAQTA